MAFLTVHQLSFIFGIFGNAISFFVFLSPITTFYKIYQRKSSQGYNSIPYIIGLFSASLLLYYGVMKTHAFLIITINGAGCVFEVTYLLIYVLYATKKDKISTLRLIVLLNIGCLSLIVGVSLLLTKGAKRVALVGWACAVINVAVFAAPLSVMRQVIRTKSVEFMPIGLSICLTLNAMAWFFYGFFIRDYFIALPNILGFIFGIIQVILYLVYKKARKEGQKVGVESNADGTEDLKKSSIELETGDAKV
ncbi:hypothetical protein M9H77_21097 [Catharanthus roseus]|uniref:Uncharacterized protein n=1 Tax=Catharanthus roseus TaxID=4058 RepID=A0ACC0AMG6_CATRO|nr:hypothetical protein M9H77_21097 [Catharanthus roseus]